MRNLAVRLILWLCDRFGVHPPQPENPFGPNVWLDADPAELSEEGLEWRAKARKWRVGAILDLCDRYDVWPIDEARINMGTDKKARSQRWEAFAREDGGLFDMLDKIKAEYLAKMGQVKPGDAKTLEALAIGARVAEGLRAEVRSVIAAGEVEARNEDRAARLSVVPTRKSV